MTLISAPKPRAGTYGQKSLLTRYELESLRREMQQDGKWAEEILAARKKIVSNLPLYPHIESTF